MTEIESIVEPDSVTDDVGRESVPLVSVHSPVLPNSVSLFGSTGRYAFAQIIELYFTIKQCLIFETAAYRRTSLSPLCLVVRQYQYRPRENWQYLYWLTV